MSNDIVHYVEEPSQDERVLAMLIYLLSFVTTIIAPLIIWLLKKNDSAFIDSHGKEYFNFIISYAIYSIIASILIAVFIGLILLPIIAVMSFIFIIIAAVKAYNGEEYVIPLTIRFIK
ncbi:DUF4870 domain-containing protein [Alkalicoccobacillus porphyridii]|uniref:DUF4870 domain-containing protein n=1 Tax=Alkalicoccobacillus porphyridii TaxID=2597270 RepID=A0A554A008_9BACI|nr:DUF4870 domain-containing protein [Alkalicoccobacillus porphyridii]TSB47013.1 DUF4870 domain-containing protein [Alkalicoccobacillus porphyridii]